MKEYKVRDLTIDLLIILSGIAAIFWFGVAVTPYMQPIP
jgi:hypothetical protein